MNIRHQLYPETMVPCFTTSKNHPKYALPVIPPPTTILPIPHSTVVLLRNYSYWVTWNLCGWTCITHRLPVLVKPWQYMMIYFPHSRKCPPPQCIYKQNKGITSDYNSWFFTKLHNSMYATWRCKNKCSTLCITTVTTQILPAPYNVLGSLKNILTH